SAFTKVNTTDHNGNGTFAETVSATAPAAAGTYNLYVHVWNTNSPTDTNYTDSFILSSAVVVDNTAPTVSSINRSGATPTNAASVSFAVTFSESVSGVDSGDFALASSGVSGTSITVSGSGNSYLVTVNTGSGDGSIGL